MAGVDFDVAFEVPVFATGETVAAPEPGQPLLAEYREETLTSEALAAAGITLLPAGPGGHPAVAFSSRHIRGTKFVLTGLALGAGAGVAALLYFRFWIAALFVGFFDLIFLLIAWSLWGADTEVEIQPTEVIVRSRKPGGWREQRLPRGQVGRIVVEKSMSSGDRQYFKLVLFGLPGADPGQPGAAEPFAIRKLRYQIARARRHPGSPAPLELLASLKLQPRFQVIAAANVPGPAFAEGIARMLEQRIGVRAEDKVAPVPDL